MYKGARFKVLEHFHRTCIEHIHSLLTAASAAYARLTMQISLLQRKACRVGQFGRRYNEQCCALNNSLIVFLIRGSKKEVKRNRFGRALMQWDDWKTARVNVARLDTVPTCVMATVFFLRFQVQTMKDGEIGEQKKLFFFQVMGFFYC